MARRPRPALIAPPLKGTAEYARYKDEKISLYTARAREAAPADHFAQEFREDLKTAEALTTAARATEQKRLKAQRRRLNLAIMGVVAEKNATSVSREVEKALRRAGGDVRRLDGLQLHAPQKGISAAARKWGIPKATVQGWFEDGACPTPEHLQIVSEHTRWSVRWLQGYEDEPPFRASVPRGIEAVIDFVRQKLSDEGIPARDLRFLPSIEELVLAMVDVGRQCVQAGVYRQRLQLEENIQAQQRVFEAEPETVAGLLAPEPVPGAQSVPELPAISGKPANPTSEKMEQGRAGSRREVGS